MDFSEKQNQKRNKHDEGDEQVQNVSTICRSAIKWEKS